MTDDEGRAVGGDRRREIRYNDIKKSKSAHSSNISRYIYLQFLQGEATSSTDFGVVLESGAADGRAQQSVDGARSDQGSLLGTRNTAALLLARLVEPGLDSSLPVLVEMAVG